MNLFVVFKDCSTTFNLSMYEVGEVTMDNDNVEPMLYVIETSGRRHSFKMSNVAKITVI